MSKKQTMTFDELLIQVKRLSDAAKMQIPDVLSKETKDRPERKNPEEIEKHVSAAIYEVSHGSVAPLDALIKKRL